MTNNNEDREIIDAINAIASHTDEGDERHIVAKAIESMTGYALTDGFDDWAFGGGSWDHVETPDQAWAQLETIAGQWDELNEGE